MMKIKPSAMRKIGYMRRRGEERSIRPAIRRADERVIDNATKASKI